MSNSKSVILCIDDSKDDLIFLSNVLSDDFDVKTFSNASDAMIFLEQFEPFLIISDVMMPEIKGFDFFENYRAFFPQRNTPVLFLTSISDTESISRALDIGVYDVINKPIAPKILLSKVKAILKREGFKKQSITQSQNIKSKGMLSTIKVAGRTITIQTEILGNNKLETTATLEGKIIKKTDSMLSNETDESLSDKILKQHQSVEEEVRQRLEEIASTKKKEEDNYALLFERGLEEYRGGKYEDALKIWEKALELFPKDKILKINIEIVRKKLNKANFFKLKVI